MKFSKRMFLVALLAASPFGSPSTAQAETITETLVAVHCIAAGTGAGTCDIVFPSNTISSCTGDTRVNFDPTNGVLGQEIYSMALTATTSSKQLYISLVTPQGCTKAGIDSIRILR